LKESLLTVRASSGDETLAEEIIGGFAEIPVSQAKLDALNSLTVYLGALKNTDKLKWGIEEILKFRDAIPPQFRNQTDPIINGNVLLSILAKKEEALKADPANAGLKTIVDLIKSKLPADMKKGF